MPHFDCALFQDWTTASLPTALQNVADVQLTPYSGWAILTVSVTVWPHTRTS